MIDPLFIDRLELLYRAQDLAELRRRLSDGLAGFGYWGVCERRDAAQVTDNYFDPSRYVWDNYASRVGRRRTELLRALLEAAKSRGIAEENARLHWLSRQRRPYAIISSAPERFGFHSDRCRLVEDFGLRCVDILVLPTAAGPGGAHRIWTDAEDRSALRNASEAIGLLTVYNHMRRLLTVDWQDLPGHQSEAVLDHGSDRPVELNARERETLRWAAAGKTHQDIATITGTSARTVRYHIEAARDRYGFATTQQTIVRAALDYGFDPLG